MGSLRNPDFDQWKSFIYLVIFAVILLARETTTSPVSSRSENSWQHVNPNPHSVSKRATRSENLQNLRSLLKQKASLSHEEQRVQTHSEPDGAWTVRDFTRLINLLNSGNDELSRFSSYPQSSSAAADSSDDLPSFSGELEKQESFNLEDSTPYDSSPFNSVDLDSYSSSPELPSSSSSSSSYELNKRRMPQPGVKRSYRNRWSRSRSRSRSRYNYIKRVLPCYLNVVTCF